MNSKDRCCLGRGAKIHNYVPFTFTMYRTNFIFSIMIPSFPQTCFWLRGISLRLKAILKSTKAKQRNNKHPEKEKYIKNKKIF